MNELKIFKDYMESERNLSPNTIVNYISDIKQFSDFIDKPLKQIRHTDISRFIIFIRSNGVSVSTANRKLSSLKTFFKFFVKQGSLNHNPADTLEGGKAEQRLPKPIDFEDIEKLINTTDCLRDKAILEILYGTGIRRAELVNIRKKDINFRDSYVKVLGKGCKERIVPLHPTALKLATKLTVNTDSEWLFPSPKNGNKQLSYRAINTIITRLADRAGLSNITPHRFRHSFCSHLYSAGAELKVIQDLAGHQNPNTTQLYTKINNRRNHEEYLLFHPRASGGGP